MIAVTHRSRAAPRDEPRLNPRSKGYKAAVGSLAPGQPLTDSPPPRPVRVLVEQRVEFV